MGFSLNCIDNVLQKDMLDFFFKKGFSIIEEKTSVKDDRFLFEYLTEFCGCDVCKCNIYFRRFFDEGFLIKIKILSINESVIKTSENIMTDFIVKSVEDIDFLFKRNLYLNCIFN